MLTNEVTTIKKLLLAKGWSRPLMLLILFISTNISVVCVQLWIALWRSDAQAAVQGSHYDNYYYVFLVIMVAVSVLVFIREFLFTYLTLSNLDTNYKQVIL